MVKVARTVAGWTLLEPIGRGGQASVFRALRGEGAEPHALKLLKLSHAKKTQRFLKEARVHALLSSQNAANIMPIVAHNLDEVENGETTGYLVMPLAACSLEDRDVRSTLLGRLELCLEVFEGIVAGAAAAHRAGVVHRDLKPANVLFLDRTLKNPLISDFGICFLKADAERVTSVHETVGARYFMAPEQEKGGRVDVTPAADVYALGKLLCYMLTNRYVFREEFAQELEGPGLSDDPRVEIVKQELLAKSVIMAPEARIPDAQQLLEAVRLVRQGFRAPSLGPNGNGHNEAETTASFDRYVKGLATPERRALELELEETHLQRLKAAWETAHRQIEHHPDQSEAAARSLVVSQNEAIALALAIARVDQAESFPALKRFLEGVVALPDRTAGHPAVIGVPYVLAGFTYMATATMALVARSWRTLGLLLSKKLEWHYQSDKPLFSRGFELSYFFHSEAFARKADRIHEFFREILKRHWLAVFKLDAEQLVNRYLQCQMLMCLRTAQLASRGDGRGRIFADFGRFYAARVTPLLQEFAGDADVAAGLASAFDEEPAQFAREFNDRLRTVRNEMWSGTHYIWESIDEWNAGDES